MRKSIRTLGIAGAIAAMAALAACSSNPDANSSTAGQGAMSGTPNGAVSADSNALAAGNVPAGSEADLQKNVGDRVFFALDKTDISAEGRKTLERQAEWLKRYPNVTVSIEGHCDERGTREYNLALGDRRATAVKNMLVSLGINPSRIKTISYGKERPAVVGSTESAYAQNRRGVTVVD